MQNRYFHPGWTGEPYGSDFEAKWGLVRFDEMFDGRECKSNTVAMIRAKESGLRYMIGPKSSKHGNQLFKIEGTSPRCVVAMLQYQQTEAKAASEKYRGSPEERLKQLVRVARTRAVNGGLPFTLDMDDIVRRGLAGRCEATGMPFDLSDVGTSALRNPFAPSLDQVDPGKGYTKENVQVVCWGWNLMKSNFEPTALDRFLRGLLTDNHVKR